MILVDVLMYVKCIYALITICLRDNLKKRPIPAVQEKDSSDTQCRKRYMLSL